MVQIRIIKPPSGSRTTSISWMSMVFLIAIRTPLVLVECVAWKTCGKWWFLHSGVLGASRWVSWTHSMSPWRAMAVFHSECRLAGWLSPLTFRESMVNGILWVRGWWMLCATLTVSRCNVELLYLVVRWRGRFTEIQGLGLMCSGWRTSSGRFLAGQGAVVRMD